jgi:AbrB family looped-hinge helix DNA binding protein
MRITSKGQVTIPQALREKAGIMPGAEVEFVEENGRLYVRKVDGGGRGQALVRRMRGQGSVRMSTDEILALTRGSRPGRARRRH